MPITVAEYAVAKRLDPERLVADFQLSDVHYPAVGAAIRIPYFDMNGRELAPRFRVALEGNGKVRQSRGTSPTLYNQWRIGDALDSPDSSIALCEGESDVHTCYARPARLIHTVGIPGANTWRDEWAACFDGFRRIFLVVEPDTGGQALLRAVGRSSLRDRLHLLFMPPGHKDPSSLWIADPETFYDRMQAAMDAAPTFQLWWDARLAEARAEYPTAASILEDSLYDVAVDLAGEITLTAALGQTVPPLLYVAVEAHREALVPLLRERLIADLPSDRRALLAIGQSEVELFHDPDVEAFARVTVRDHHEAWPVAGALGMRATWPSPLETPPASRWTTCRVCRCG